MVRLLSVPVVALALLTPATAPASASEVLRMQGSLPGGGHVSIAVWNGRIDGAAVERHRWDFRGVPVMCGGQRRIAARRVHGRDAIARAYADRNTFGFGTRGVGLDGRTYGTYVNGRLLGQRAARGWVRVHGSSVLLRSGRYAECDSGRVRWTATRR